jgi:NAD(P)-dependent dehydrogenase (short-subunit alcohol dehydrogenase family)
VNQVIVISGASSGFGALTARALADAGHNVYAGMRNTTSRNADAVTQLSRYAASRHVELKPVEMDVSSKESVDAAITSIVEEQGRLDVVVHNAGHMVTGPAEAFTPEEVDDIYDTNVLGTQRVNRAALLHLRTQGSGLLVWVSSTSVKGGTPPYLGRTSRPRPPWTRWRSPTPRSSLVSASTPRSSFPGLIRTGRTTLHTPDMRPTLT